MRSALRASLFVLCLLSAPIVYGQAITGGGGGSSFGTPPASPIAFGTGGGIAQAQTVTTTPNITTLVTGTFVTWLPVAANTAAAPTLAVGTTAATAVTKHGTVALLPGDLLSTIWAIAEYDGTEWVLQNPATEVEGGLPTGAGSANAQTLTVSPAITAYSTGMVFNFTPGVANTGATTIAISGLTTKSITKCGTTALIANDLTTTAIAVILYDGTEFQLLNPQGTGCGSGGASSQAIFGSVSAVGGGVDYGNTTYYIALAPDLAAGNAYNTAEAQVQLISPIACTAKNLSLQTGAGAGSNRVITFRKNGADTTLTVSVAQNSTGRDAVDSVSVAAGDLINISTTASSVTAAKMLSWSMTCQ